MQIPAIFERLHEARQSKAWRDYHSHVFDCPGCSPARQRYCKTGFDYWKAYDLPCRADEILKQKSLTRRRALMDICPQPLRADLEVEVMRRWAEKRETGR